MSRQAALLIGAKIAMLACEGLLASVYSQVCRQAALVTGAKTAMLARVWLLASVHSQVCSQAALPGGFISTVITRLVWHDVTCSTVHLTQGVLDDAGLVHPRACAP